MNIERCFPAWRAAWAPPPRLSASDWAEAYRVLPRRGTAEPGPYRLDRTPYMRGILDVLGDHEHNEVIFCKPVQVGGSEVGRTAVAFWVDTEADNVLLVLPNQAAAEEYLKERIQPLLEEPRMARWRTKRGYDVRRNQIDLLHCSLYLGWSGSPQTLASRAIRFAVSDETDKAQDHSKEAGALDLVRDRLVTYLHRAKHFILSTPTTVDGPIWQCWLNTADKRRFHAPCPHCGVEDWLRWEQVRWDRREEEDEEELLRIADQLMAGDLKAWYVCPHCKGDIHEGQRMRMVERGRWRSELGEEPRSRRVAFQISALYSPWVSFARTVSEYVRGKVAHDLRNFYNSFLGIPHEQAEGGTDSSVLEQRARENQAWVVPEWATALVAGADTQVRKGKVYWYWVIRAWGPNLRSRLIGWGKAESTDDLIAQTIDRRIRVEGAGNYSMSPAIVCVDSGGAVETPDGSTTDIVYGLARSDPGRIVPVKGYSGRKRPDRLIRASNVDYQPPGAPKTQVLLHILDTEGMKDIAAKLIRAEEPTLWEECPAADAQYVSHMTAEEKTRVRIGNGFELRWINNTRRRNDLWDASIYCLAGAKMVRADQREAQVRTKKERPSEPKRAPKPTKPSSPYRRTPRLDKRKPWISSRR